ncbi:MAG: hypothetical protein WAN53_03250 [Candidatus Bathyarchaeia archaeon]|jgi:hypothetical protein
MSVEEYTKQTLWPILIETAHALIMYPNHKAYTRDVILPEKPEITAAELAVRLKMPLGEAVVILHELSEERKTKP